MCLLKRQLNPTFLLYHRTVQTGSTWHIGILREYMRLWPNRLSLFWDRGGRARQDDSGMPLCCHIPLFQKYEGRHAFVWVQHPQSQETRQVCAGKIGAEKPAHIWPWRSHLPRTRHGRIDPAAYTKNEFHQQYGLSVGEIRKHIESRPMPQVPPASLHPFKHQ